MSMSYTRTYASIVITYLLLLDVLKDANIETYLHVGVA